MGMNSPTSEFQGTDSNLNRKWPSEHKVNLGVFTSFPIAGFHSTLGSFSLTLSSLLVYSRDETSYLVSSHREQTLLWKPGSLSPVLRGNGLWGNARSPYFLSDHLISSDEWLLWLGNEGSRVRTPPTLDLCWAWWWIVQHRIGQILGVLKKSSSL